MNYLPNKKGFLGIDNKFSINEKVVIVPFGLEKTVTYGKGTKNGPKEIIKASHQIELYDEDLNCEPHKKIGIKTLKPFTIHKDIKRALDQIASINKKILHKKLFSMTLGGEHSITPGCIRPFAKKYKNIKIIYNKRNEGVSACRNKGIKNAVGKYIFFLDSDDYLIDNGLKKLANLKIISKLRYNLREQIKNSHICNDINFYKNFESSIEQIINE